MSGPFDQPCVGRGNGLDPRVKPEDDGARGEAVPNHHNLSSRTQRRRKSGIGETRLVRWSFLEREILLALRSRLTLRLAGMTVVRPRVCYTLMGGTKQKWALASPTARHTLRCHPALDPGSIPCAVHSISPAWGEETDWILGSSPRMTALTDTQQIANNPGLELGSTPHCRPKRGHAVWRRTGVDPRTRRG
ncbi:hypothetical protein JM93_00889 [Roseibium hamelinense]|uniref:Uncharacterized protein n=1 Tax=Roseibium hamelinense TaxID=150831 RepID=A0A562TIS4_9HYPH|nr:hypothetical protein JM93_00889 [Roseibium hamelinense]